MIDNQEVLTVSDDNDTIRIPLTEESKADIDALLDAPVGTSKRLKETTSDRTLMLLSIAGQSRGKRIPDPIPTI